MSNPTFPRETLAALSEALTPERAASRVLAETLLNGGEVPELTEAEVWALAEPLIPANVELAFPPDPGKPSVRVLMLDTDHVTLPLMDDANLPEFVTGTLERGGVRAEAELQICEEEREVGPETTQIRPTYRVRLLD